MTQRTFNSWAEDLLAEGEKRGETRGEKRGLDRGAQSACKGIRAVLRTRFGSVSKDVHRLLDGCDDFDRLEAALERAITVPSLDAFHL